jgi:hypothetical protein
MKPVKNLFLDALLKNIFMKELFVPLDLVNKITSVNFFNNEKKDISSG